MIDNPIYNGDYIAQAKAEIKQFMLTLDSVEKQKAQGQEYERGNRIPMDLASFHSYSFPHFQKYADEKLSSANPKIYIIDLDEIYVTLQKCISKYCLIIEKKITETEQIFAENAYYNPQNLALTNLIFFTPAKYCFLIKAYYKKKRKLFDLPNDKFEENSDIDYINDREKVKEILGQDFDTAIEADLNIFITHILFYKYGGSRPKKLPDIHTIGVSQRKHIRTCVQIVKNYNWDDKGRDHLAGIFGHLIKAYKDFEPLRYNQETIRKGMY